MRAIHFVYHIVSSQCHCMHHCGNIWCHYDILYITLWHPMMPRYRVIWQTEFINILPREWTWMALACIQPPQQLNLNLNLKCWWAEKLCFKCPFIVPSVHPVCLCMHSLMGHQQRVEAVHSMVEQLYDWKNVCIVFNSVLHLGHASFMLCPRRSCP